jgi:hypothetical protein
VLIERGLIIGAVIHLTKLTRLAQSPALAWLADDTGRFKIVRRRAQQSADR